jgi:hypothetical protein
MVQSRTIRLASIVFSQIILSATVQSGEPKSVFELRKAASSTTIVAPTLSKRPKILDYVAESHLEVVSSVLKAPTLSAKATDDDFVAHAKVYDFLLANPDRTSLAWQRLKVPCVEITNLGKGQFFWGDENSELTWQTVGTFENGVIWYASGKVKAGPFIPAVPVKAVAVLQSPHTQPDAQDSASYKPVVNVYIQCDSKLAAAAMRLAGPSAPRMAEEGAEQLMFFFSGVARYLHKKPDQIETLLGPKKK